MVEICFNETTRKKIHPSISAYHPVTVEVHVSYFIYLVVVSPQYEPVPSQVQSLQVMPGSHSGSLRAAWAPGEGDVDSYTIALTLGGQVQAWRELPKQVTETEFQNLLPGQLYNITVQSVSGALVNNRTSSGRTGE